MSSRFLFLKPPGEDTVNPGLVSYSRYQRWHNESRNPYAEHRRTTDSLTKQMQESNTVEAWVRASGYTYWCSQLVSSSRQMKWKRSSAILGFGRISAITVHLLPVSPLKRPLQLFA